MRWMLTLAHARPGLEDKVRLNTEFRSDLCWWACFLERWNARSLLSVHGSPLPDITYFTDASGAWGFGGCWDNAWFSCPWDDYWKSPEIAITTKELLPVVVAVGLWGARWRHKHVLVRSDNSGAVNIVNHKDSKVPLNMHLLCCLHFLCSHHDITIQAEHIEGRCNIAADALSRNLLQAYLKTTPGAERTTTPIPAAPRQLLISERPDWLSPSWRQRLSTLFATP